MRDDIPIGTLVSLNGGDIGVVVDHHYIKAWPDESADNIKYKVIYKINIITKNLYKYCYSYEMVILSE
jgi:hypothetical protein